MNTNILVKGSELYMDKNSYQKTRYQILKFQLINEFYSTSKLLYSEKLNKSNDIKRK
jgi:hypothetical protein